MKNTYEEYVKPPSYIDSQVSKDLSDIPLISKLRVRIQKDLNQINGVYDIQIAEVEEKKQKLMQKLELESKANIESINNQRIKDISIYNEKAEKHIDNLISSMHNSPQKITFSWWEKLFVI